ncbi:unnamed protein product [Phytophthora fragariaefolia]|uniref:Unnamed protein product n=1 Tax=Phytophthora fragariaefolia TaxID=1490495 RepID=A0A9W7D055_9STRA|nr:unnamed protein product [Phytophthora fragariaefolia]
MPKDWSSENPYPDLRLSEDVKSQISNLVNAYLKSYLRKYENFAAVDNRQVDEQRWKHIKTKDDLHVYEDHYRRESEQGIGPRNLASSQDHVAPPKSDMPVMLRAGTVLGRLDDLMFGVVNPTLDSMRVRASYVHGIDANAILCPIVEPSKDEPFRSLIVKWLSLDNPFESTNLIKTRDFVYVEATGILHFTNGDRVGYHLKHSLEFRQTKPRPNIIRAKLSYCGFYRQIHDDVIDVFGTSAMVPGGGIPRFISVRTATEALLATTNLLVCGQMKKMSWMLQQQLSVGLQSGRDKCCVMCYKSTSSGFVGKLGKTTCNMCYGSVWYSCKINWRISFTTLGSKAVHRKIAFCGTCINRVSTCDAEQAAERPSYELQGLQSLFYRIPQIRTF